MLPFSGLLTKTRPLVRHAVSKIAENSNSLLHTQMLWHQNMSADDTRAARFNRIAVKDVQRIPIDQPIQLSQLTGDAEPSVAATAFALAGAKIGYYLVNTNLQTVNKTVVWPGQGSGMVPRLPKYCQGWQAVRYMVAFHSAQQFMETTALLAAYVEGDWFASHTTHYDGQHGMNIDNTEVPPPKQVQAAKPAKSPDTSVVAHEEETDQHKTDADAWTIPPDALLRIVGDPVITELVNRSTARGPINLYPSARILETWDIPASIANDLESLGWLSIAIPMHYGIYQQAGATSGVIGAQRLIAEQIKTVSAQKGAEALKRLGSEAKTVEVRQQIDDLEKVLLPGKDVEGTSKELAPTDPTEASHSPAAAPASPVEESASAASVREGIAAYSAIGPVRFADDVPTLTYDATLPAMETAAVPTSPD
jgi:hypothetical protein